MLGLALDQTRAQQASQTVANRRAGYAQALLHLDDRHRTVATDQVQQFSIRRFGQGKTLPFPQAHLKNPEQQL